MSYSPLSTKASRLGSIMLLGVATIGGVASPARAQAYVTRADALLSAGRVFAAESLYYMAVRRAPRDPEARLALGKYLAARGAWRVGAVLMEEARYFGGDAQVVANELIPVYARLGDYGQLAVLRSSQLTYAERSRAEWLRDNPPEVDGPDSVRVQYAAVDSRTMGRVHVRLGSDSVSAVIDPRAEGLTLDTVWAQGDGIRTFGSKGAKPLRRTGVAAEAGLGALILRNVPVKFAPQRDRRSATVGLDVLGRFAPTFDLARGTMVLRKNGRVAAGQAPGLRYPTLTLRAGPRIIRDNSLVPLNHVDAARLLRNRRWTLDTRRGEVIVHEP
ncbi:MAG: tetratricopeptide repeat protein [Gemmatimonadaceae bacterium]